MALLSNLVLPTVVIGIDAAASLSNVGVVAGTFVSASTSAPTIDEVLPSSPAAVAQLLRSARATGQRVLVSIDAPLGWPADLGASLVGHSAGSHLPVEPNLLFRRATDRWVKAHVGQQPLDVGADRIARTAHAALAFLEETRTRSGERLPLAWAPDFADSAACIEVYPAATLRARGLTFRGYKDASEASLAVRTDVLDRLGDRICCSNGVRHGALANDHVFDAALCVVAGFDFLAGSTVAPADQALAEREGWIWVRAPRLSLQE